MLEEKKRENKMKRYIRVISLIIILCGLFIYFKNKPVNYELDYTLNDYKVYEKYNKNDKYYSFICRAEK